MRVFWIAAVVVVIDQLSKLAVVQNMHLRQSIPLIGDWFKLTFTENPGMAFGLTLGPAGIVALFSLVATALVIWYITQVWHGYWPYVTSLALILGGAIGNIIDRVFYGVIFGYAPLFQGRVVDFVHVDIGYVGFPDIIPVIGGSYLALFPIWNVADMAIVGGVVGVLLFQGAFHRHERSKPRPGSEVDTEKAVSDVPHSAATLGLPGKKGVDVSVAEQSSSQPASASPQQARLSPESNEEGPTDNGHSSGSMASEEPRRERD